MTDDRIEVFVLCLGVYDDRDIVGVFPSFNAVMAHLPGLEWKQADKFGMSWWACGGTAVSETCYDVTQWKMSR